MNRVTNAGAWWLAPPEALLRDLDARPDGLTQAEAARRLARHGPNTFRDRTQSIAVELLLRFRNPLVLILIAASVLSAVTGDVAGFFIISAMVLLSVVVDFIQEHRAQRTALKLRQSVALRATILRNGAPKEVAVSKVVPGDVVLLSAGSLVPADGIVLEARHLFVNQSLLTGEAYPAEKRAGPPADSGTDVERAINALFMGTSVVSGTARLLVCRTGDATAMGSIAQTLMREPPPTAFERGTRRFGMLIMRVTMLMVLFVLMVNTLTHKPLIESFLFAIALAVGLTPELLPMIVSVTLARGAQRMAARRVIVKRLAAVQNLGSMDVLCTDKTGTLTEARMRVAQHVDAAGADSARVVDLAWVNSHFESGLKSPLDDALLAHGATSPSAKRWAKIDEAPFDFERRRVSVLVDDGQARLLVVKGAPEEIMRLSSHCELAAGASTKPFDAAARERAARQLEVFGRDGLRVLGVACKPVERGHQRAEIADEADLVFCGFVAFADPPKAGAGQTLEALHADGIAVKIVTGDNEVVTAHLCAQLGIPIAGTLTGAEIDRLSDQALAARAVATNLFCRVNPAQKNRIILALKARGHVVGYLGDGINDAPALHSADVSVSVDTAVDVAKEAADLILLRHDLSVLHEGVIEGRRTFANVRKYIMMSTSSNFGNMFSMAAAAVFLPFLPMLPAQILLNNLLYDLSEVAIPLDAVDADEIRAPQAWDMDLIRNFMWAIGPISSVFDLVTFYLLYAVIGAGESVFQTVWFVESLATQVFVIFVIRTKKSPFASRPHPALVASSLAVVVLAAALPFTTAGRALGFQPFAPAYFALLAALVAGYLVAVELAKHAFYRHFAKVPAHAR